jgi:phosphonate transport system substrate-binding protein
MRRITTSLVISAMLMFLGACSFSEDTPTNASGVPTTLRVGIIPNVAPDKQQARYKPFADYLAKKLDVKVELFVASDYAGVVEALASKHVDMAYLGGLTYAQAEQQVPLTPMVTEIDRETKTREYESAIVVKKDSPFRSVQDVLAGRSTFAFGDISSTSGSLFPRIMLVDAGAQCSAQEPSSCPPLSKTSFVGGHDAVAQAVAVGSAGAGGLELRILHRLEQEGAVAAGALRVIESRRVMGYPWVARTALGAKAINEITRAFEQMREAKLLELMRAEGYGRVTAVDYELIRTKAKELGLAAKK